MELKLPRPVPAAFVLLLALAVVASCGGGLKGTRPDNNAVAPTDNVVPAAPDYVHSVRYPRETLSIVAAWYTGDKMKYKELALANPEMNPSVVKIGMKIRIPGSLLVTRDPMPAEHVNRFYPDPPPRPIQKPTEPEPALAPPKE